MTGGYNNLDLDVPQLQFLPVFVTDRLTIRRLSFFAMGFTRVIL
jgi:hypothetical protein